MALAYVICSHFTLTVTSLFTPAIITHVHPGVIEYWLKPGDGDTR